MSCHVMSPCCHVMSCVTRCASACCFQGGSTSPSSPHAHAPSSPLENKLLDQMTSLIIPIEPVQNKQTTIVNTTGMATPSTPGSNTRYGHEAGIRPATCTRWNDMEDAMSCCLIHASIYPARPPRPLPPPPCLTSPKRRPMKVNPPMTRVNRVMPC